MVDHSENLIDAVLSSAVKDTLSFGKFGIEKESLRIIQSQITQSTHPKKIGSALCNRYITTDFSESQLELITPPQPSTPPNQQTTNKTTKPANRHTSKPGNQHY